MAPKNVSICSDVTPEDLYNFQFHLNGPVSLVIIAFGLFGILKSWRFLRPKRCKSRFSKLCLLLVSWDVMLLVSTLHLYVIPTLVTGTKPWKGKIVYFYVIFYPLCNLTMTGAKLTILALTWQRFLALKYPFRQRVRENASIKAVVFIIILVAVVTCIPLLFELTASLCFDSRERSLTPLLRPTKIRLDPYYLYIYRIFILLVMDNLIPFASVFALTILSLVTKQRPVSARIRNLRSRTNEQQSARQAIIMLVVIIKFLICYSMPIGLNLLEVLTPNFYRNKPLEIVVDIANCLVVLHSGTNWLMFGRKRAARKQSESTLLLSENPKVSRVADVSMLSIEQKQIFARLIQNKSMQRLGLSVLQRSIRNNPTLLYALRHSRVTSLYDIPKRSESALEELDTLEEQLNPIIQYHGRHIIGGFFAKITADLCEGNGSLVSSRNELRRIGFRHFEFGVTMRLSDWKVVREEMLETIIKDRDSEEEREVAQKFVSLIIGEIKNGFLCQAVNEAHEL